MDFVGKFFTEFSGLDWYEWYDRWLSNGYGHGRAIIDFMQWETDSGRLDNSDWWRAANGGMIDRLGAPADQGRRAAGAGKTTRAARPAPDRPLPHLPQQPVLRQPRSVALVALSWMRGNPQ